MQPKKSSWKNKIKYQEIQELCFGFHVEPSLTFYRLLDSATIVWLEAISSLEA